MNKRITTAIGLAAAALALALTNAVGGLAILQAGLAPVIGIATIAFAAAAFAVAWRQRSYMVSGLLVAAGLVGMTPALIALAAINFAVIVIPGPILGVIFGLAIVGLGLAAGVRSARTAVVAAR